MANIVQTPATKTLELSVLAHTPSKQDQKQLSGTDYPNIGAAREQAAAITGHLSLD
jgi:hypothetical protein